MQDAGVMQGWLGKKGGKKEGRWSRKGFVFLGRVEG